STRAWNRRRGRRMFSAGRGPMCSDGRPERVGRPPRQLPTRWGEESIRLFRMQADAEGDIPPEEVEPPRAAEYQDPPDRSTGICCEGMPSPFSTTIVKIQPRLGFALWL